MLKAVVGGTFGAAGEVFVAAIATVVFAIALQRVRDALPVSTGELVAS